MNILNTIITISVFSVSLACQPMQEKNTETNTNQIEISADTSFNFENYETGKLPVNWSSAITGKGKKCNWKILKDNNNKILAQISEEKADYRFNIIINDSLFYKDAEINVRFKGISGKNDQGGGPVWRYVDENNYYVARANPLENNFRVYKVVNGNRKELKSARVKIDSNKWYDIKITMKGNKITCFFNKTAKLETIDNTFTHTGKIGLWTKSDAVTYFDDLKIKQVK